MSAARPSRARRGYVALAGAGLLVTGPSLAAGPLLASSPGDGDPGSATESTAEPEIREIVVETQPGASVSAHRLDAEEIAAIPIRTAEDALRLAPGLVLVQHGAEGKGQQYFLRGFDAAHGIDFEVEIDGMPVNEWSNIHAQGYLDLGLMIPELVGSIEVLPGPFALDQGPFALAGSARYALGVGPDQRGLRAAFGFGSTIRERLVASYSPRTGDGSRFVAAELVHDRGWGQGRDSQRATVMARQHLLERPGLRLSALVLGQSASFGLPGVTRLDHVESGELDFYGAHDPGRGRSQRAQLALDLALAGPSQRARVLAWTGARSLSLTENFTGFVERPELGDRRAQQHRAIPFGLRLDHAWLAAPRLTLLSGLGLRGDLLRQSEDRVDLGGRPFERTRAAAAVQADLWALAGVEVAATRTLSVAAGVRVDGFFFDVRDGSDESNQGDGAGGGRIGGGRIGVGPRANLRWRPWPALEVALAYGRGVRPPEARAFTRAAPERFGLSDDRVDDEGPRVTHADAGELGLRWAATAKLDLRVAGFVTYLARESIYDHVSRTNLQLSATRRLGAELSVAARPRPWLALVASGTYVDARFVRSRNPVPLAPIFVASARGWIVHRSGLRAGLLAFGWAPRPLPYGARGSSFARVDATLGWHLDRIRVDLAIENLLAMRLREGEYAFASDWDPRGQGSELPALHFVPGPPLTARVELSVVW